jgi:hypothetical protein
MDTRMFKTYGAEVPIAGNHQVRGLPALEGCELQTAHCMVFPFQIRLLQTHINFPRFLPIFPDFLERLSHLAPIY